MAQLGRKFQVLLLGLILGAICFPQSSSALTRSIDPAVQKLIDDYVNKVFLPISRTTKLGLTIVQNNGELLYTTGYGMADHEKGIPNGNETQFLIGSITKSFTATVTIKVLHEVFPDLGEAVLDTPIRKLVPAANFTLIDRFRTEHATFRDLLAHRLCIVRDDLQLSTEPFSTASEMFYRERYAEEMCGMRSEFQYNNQMYVIAGELAGILAKKTYTELLNNLLEDIGMHNSSLTSKSDDFSKMPFRGQPYYVMDNASHPMNPELIKRVAIYNAAGGLFVPPNDMVKYIQFHLNLGNVDGKQIIREDVMKWLTKLSSQMPGMHYKTTSDNDISVNTFGYGLGVMLATYDSWQYIHHGGYFPPYQSLLSVFPSQNLGIFTSGNEGPLYLDPTSLHAFIFEVLRGTINPVEKVSKLIHQDLTRREKKEANKGQAVKKFLERNSKGPKQDPSDIIGKYGSGASGDVEIVEKFNSETNATELYVNYGIWGKGWMKNFAGPVFYIKWDTDLVQEFYAGGDSVGVGYVSVENETLEFFTPIGNEFLSRGKFRLGVSLDTLPPIPYAPDSCGPEN